MKVRSQSNRVVEDNSRIPSAKPSASTVAVAASLSVSPITPPIRSVTDCPLDSENPNWPCSS